MCSRSDVEHLQPEAPATSPHWCPAYDLTADPPCAHIAAERWALTRQTQLDERAAQVLSGALEDHRRAGL